MRLLMAGLVIAAWGRLLIGTVHPTESCARRRRRRAHHPQQGEYGNAR
ncbi:MAG: hypothetical protein MJE77_10470 [Proteobacteria bacterium]|nr:hypothetical protein [Pseudomonadota bacterium]